MKEIFLTLREKKLLMEKFDVTGATINNALRYRSNSYLAAEIRKVAKEMGGVERDENKSADELTNQNNSTDVQE